MLAYSHIVEPELYKPIPRKVRMRPGLNVGVGCLRIFILPFIAIGIFTFCSAVNYILNEVFGTPIFFVMNNEDNSKHSTLFMIFFTLFWNFVTWIFGYLAYIAPYQQRWLCQYGKVGTAKIIEKTTSKDSYNNITYYVEYEFSAQYEISSVRETIKRKTSIPEEKWHITEIGMNSTILYDPKKPKKHCYYAGCIYEAVV